MQSTYLLLTVHLNLEFFSVHLWAFALVSSTVLHIVTFVRTSGFQLGGCNPCVFLTFFLGVVRAYKSIHIYFYNLFRLWKYLFVVAKIIGSPGKNDSLLFHSNLFLVWLWPLQSFECFFLLILVMAVGGRPKPELCFLLGRLRWTLLPKERYGNSLVGCGSNTHLPIERQTLFHWAIAAPVWLRPLQHCCVWQCINNFVM